MPDPNVSDRERLLRLIDGGPEVVKEVQQEREKPADKKPVAVVPAAAGTTPASADIPDLVGGRGKRSGLDGPSVLKLCAAMFLLIFAVISFIQLVQKMGKKETGVPSPVVLGASAGVPEPEDASIGLRLVGVDWGEAPVALLEDLKTGKTYFAKKNDKIKDVQVREIFKDKVLASVRGKNVELR